ncbi:MAG: YraN family protein, partial [Syntrophales bacterium]
MSLMRISTGKKGEELAAAYLEEAGYRIIERNYRCLFGEIDMVAEEGETLVFVEVKSRRS